jgi:hypothetical protein
MELLLHYKKNNLDTYQKIKDNLKSEPYLFKIKENDNLYLIRYDKLNSNLNFDFVRASRGIILEKNTNNIIAYPLNGKITYQNFKKMVPINEIIIEESIDGTLLNVYYYDNKWFISTNTCINAKKSYFYSKKSFFELFEETQYDIDIFDDILDKKYTYSFVLKHPENRIVTPHFKPELILVQIRNNTNFKIITNYDEHILNHFKCPKKFLFDSYNELEKQLTLLNYNQEGFVLYNNTRSLRTKIQGNEYNIAKQLKGNQSNIRFMVLEKIKQNNVADFLKYYKELTPLVNHTYFLINKFINTLQYYYYITRVEKQFIKYPYHVKPPLYEIHKIYLDKLTKYNNSTEKNKLDKPKTTKNDISNYVWSLPIKRLYFMINKESQQLTQQ